MTPEGLQVGAESSPRFELRSFGQDFDRIHHRMARLSVPVPEDLWERRSEEIYVVSRASDVFGVKIRGGKLDVKEWVRTVDGFEQWAPRLKVAFPLPAVLLQEKLFPALQTAPPDLPAGGCDLEDFLRRVRSHPELQVVRVKKRRFGYLVHGTICEYVVVLINGARVVTVGAESTEIPDLHRTLTDTGMAGLENINYLQAIKRVIGMIDRPLANE
ncbi:MAG: hypothetical protein WEG36_11715 [Gemmatimonadota bacterium]